MTVGADVVVDVSNAPVWDDDAVMKYYGTELHGGELTPGPGARIGRVDFETWFDANQEAR